MTEHPIAKYLRTRLDFLEACNADIDNRLSNDLQGAVDRGLSQEDFARYYRHIEHAVRSTFRYCMIIAVCSFLEESHKAVCRHVLPDYDGKLRAAGKRGTWLERHRRMFVNDSIALPPPVSEACDLMADFVIVRNCLVHAWGHIDNSGDASRLRPIIQKHRFFEEYADGYIFVDDEAVPEAILSSEDIVTWLAGEFLLASRP